MPRHSWQLYEEHELVRLAPLTPRTFLCPECRADRVKTTLRFRHSSSEQWGCVVTRHDYYSCRRGHGRFVSTNGSPPETAATA